MKPTKDCFQLYEVVRTECLKLEVTILGGRNISMGPFTDKFIDTPDPYVQVTVPGTMGDTKRTKAFDNNIQPYWNETFTYHLHPNETRPKLVIQLMDANLILGDTKIGETEIDTSSMEIGQVLRKTITFQPHQSEVDVEILLNEDNKPSSGIRFDNCLSDEEHLFREQRSQRVLNAMKELLGVDGPKHLGDVPCIGILGSGGGFRAMTALSGVMKALSDTKILDCATYVTSLSGSTWYLSSLYSHPTFPDPSAIEIVQKELKEATTRSIASSILSTPKYFKKLLKKKKAGLHVTFTDLFGYMVGDILLKNRTDTKLSEQREKIVNAVVPMPMYTCINVKDDKSAEEYHEWVEFSPNEVSIPKYGISLDTKLFCSKFYRGRMVENDEEPPLHYLQGIWGSAYAIHLKRIFPGDTDDNEKDDTDSEPGDEESKKINWGNDLAGDEVDRSTDDDDDDDDDQDEVDGFKMDVFKFLSDMFRMTSHRSWRSAQVPNMLRGLSFQECDSCRHLTKTEETKCDQVDVNFSDLYRHILKDAAEMFVVDAGLAFNLPFPLLLRSQRNVQLMLSFEFSGRDSDDGNPLMELAKAKEWADKKGLRFPPVDPNVYDREEGMKTMYVFRDPEDPMCPIILHFPLVNTSFREFKAPGVPRETEEEREFANFDIFYDNSPYNSTNFEYSHETFERLAKLAEYNTLLHVEEIKEVMAEAVAQRKLLAHSSLTVAERAQAIQRSISAPCHWRAEE
ncbi:cytosolic phospholipase A2-like [Lineus longissimus]|uniref:cytosolic phospholipase A2-like n=1 Tax=Lineus longissimus TaxID=88925 RepID=UPI002B4E0D40